MLEKLRALFGPELMFEHELGRGGMAVVYAAFDPGLQRRVAVKALLPELAAEQGMVERFLREARTVASLQHPHVVTVYSVRSNADAQAIVMQYVDGRSLDALLKEQSPLPLHVAGMVLAQVAEGLQHAHDRGVVHRDVKPANVLLDREGRAVVSDFGIARRENVPRTTATGMVIGTWAYMSPEQRRGEPTTAAADQYAFGVMAFELLSGRLPFTGTLVQILQSHLYDPPPSLRQFRGEVPAEVEALILRMLAKRPEDRLPSLRQAQEALRLLVKDRDKTTQILAALSQVRDAATARGRPGLDGAATVDLQKPTERIDDRLPPTVRDDASGSAGRAGGARASARNVEGPVPSTGGREDAALAPSARRTPTTKVALTAAAAVILAAIGVWAGTGGMSRAGTGASAASPAAMAPSSPSGGRAPALAGPAGGSANTGPAGGAAITGEPATVIAPAAGAGSGASGARITAGTTVAKDHQAGIGPPSQADGARPGDTPSIATPAATQPVTAPPAPPQPAAGGAAAPAMAVTLADARRIAREFVTMLNQRRYRDVAQLAPVGGDAALRDELIRLTQSAPDFEAGFDRVASAPETTKDGFSTEFILDLAWRGGKKLLFIRAHAALREDAWRLSGIGVEASQ